MVLVPLLNSVLLATTILSASSSAGARRSQPLQFVQDGNVATDGTPQVLISNNWSGSAWAKPNVRNG